MLYCINRVKAESTAGNRTAGKKAPDDVAKIIGEMPNSAVILFEEAEAGPNRIAGKILKMSANLRNWSKLKRIVKPGDTVVVQHPYEGMRGTAKSMKKCKDACFIVLIHDLLSLRKNIENKSSTQEAAALSKTEMGILDAADAVICHNEAMKKWLIQNGISEKKIENLQIFDYLHEYAELPLRHKEKAVTVAGNLSCAKCEYLYKLIEKNVNFTLHLYGPNYTGKTENVMYHGVTAPDELPGILEGSFGLVWDGTELNGCKGNAGEYVRYNNPHKTSLYLASGLPVIIWNKAALADFITRNQVGITIDSLDEINTAIDAVSEEEYQLMAQNAKKVGQKLKEGYYTKTAVERCLKAIENGHR